MKRVSGIAFSLFLLLFSLSISLFSVAYNTKGYRALQQELKIEEATGKTRQELDNINRDIVLYLQTGEPSLMTAHFGERECAHMVDVYALFCFARVVCLASAAGLSALLVARYRDRNPQKMYVSWLVQALIFLLLSALSFFAMQSWQDVFTSFHHLFFRNDLWILNVETDLMIQMMPEPFFMALAKGIAIRFVILSLLGQGVWMLAGKHFFSSERVMRKGEMNV